MAATTEPSSGRRAALYGVASAVAYASGVAIALLEVGVGLTLVAGLVAYSRVHTGVHHPIDVIAGSLTGAAIAPLTVAALNRRTRRS